MKRRIIPIIGELRDDPGERRLTTAEQAVERERQRAAREAERKTPRRGEPTRR